ncbi:MAG: antibiotic biosynthesis monooxygenase [Kiloniellales bacterium]|nr:antibiotic biosynthesis monooxygenase [Kiloniellales bacterium]
MAGDGPILRVFEVRTREGCADRLLENFATKSADVVRGKPGNLGHFFGRCVQGGGNVVVFVSVWANLDAVKARFGQDWQSSFLPAGYEDLIEECSVRHFDVGSGWHVRDLSRDSFE